MFQYLQKKKNQVAPLVLAVFGSLISGLIYKRRFKGDALTKEIQKEIQNLTEVND